MHFCVFYWRPSRRRRRALEPRGRSPGASAEGARRARPRGRSGPVPKPRAAASASGTATRNPVCEGAARCLTGTCVGRNPGDPITDGTRSVDAAQALPPADEQRARP